MFTYVERLLTYGEGEPLLIPLNLLFFGDELSQSGACSSCNGVSNHHVNDLIVNGFIDMGIDLNVIYSIISKMVSIL